MVDGLVADPTLFPSWANSGDQIFKWTDDQGKKHLILCFYLACTRTLEYFVTVSFFRLLNQPWRGQKNVTVEAKPAAKATVSVCKDLPVLNFIPDIQARCPAIADVSTMVVLASNNKQIAYYQASKINTTKLTDALSDTKNIPEVRLVRSHHQLSNASLLVSDLATTPHKNYEPPKIRHDGLA